MDASTYYQDYSFWYDELYEYGEFWYDDNYELVEPTQYFESKDYYKKQSHEFRLTSPRDERFRYTLGAFYQKSEHSITQRYKIDDIGTVIEVTGWSDTIWLTQQDRTDIDYAVFGQADFDITDKLTATFGVRYFCVDNSLKGFFGYGIGYADDDGDGPGAPDGSPSAGEDGCDLREPFGAPGPDYQGAPCLNLDKSVEQDDHSLKFGLQYELTDDKMIYATYAEGFRPGGINRRGSAKAVYQKCR